MQGPGLHLAVFRVNLDLELLPRIHAFSRGVLDRVDDSGDHVFTTDPLLLFHVLEYG